MGLNEKQIFSARTVNGEEGWKASVERLERRGTWGAWNLKIERDDDRCVVPVCDLPSAAPSDDWQNAFSIWF